MTQDEQLLQPAALTLTALVESLLFVADEPADIATLAQVLEVDMSAVETSLQTWRRIAPSAACGCSAEATRCNWLRAPKPPDTWKSFSAWKPAASSRSGARNTLHHRLPPALHARAGRNRARRQLRWRAQHPADQRADRRSRRLDTVGHPFLYATTFDFLRTLGSRACRTCRRSNRRRHPR